MDEEKAQINFANLHDSHVSCLLIMQVCNAQETRLTVEHAGDLSEDAFQFVGDTTEPAVEAVDSVGLTEEASIDGLLELPDTAVFQNAHYRVTIERLPDPEDEGELASFFQISQDDVIRRP